MRKIKETLLFSLLAILIHPNTVTATRPDPDPANMQPRQIGNFLFREKYAIEKKLLAQRDLPLPPPTKAQKRHERLIPYLDKFKKNNPDADTRQWEFLRHSLVPLSTFEKNVWREGEIFHATIKIANLGPNDAKATVFVSFNGGGYFDDRMEKNVLLPGGKIIELPDFVFPADDGVLSALDNKPSQRTFSIRLYDEKNREITRNAWPIWVFPNHTDEELAAALKGIHVSNQIDNTAVAALNAGKSVLCLSSINPKKTDEPFPPPPGHPIFEVLPADDPTLWPKQLLANPTPHTPLMFETRSGKNNRGKLFICHSDETTLRARPEGRHFLVNIAQYMKSPSFLPATPPEANATKTEK